MCELSDFWLVVTFEPLLCLLMSLCSFYLTHAKMYVFDCLKFNDECCLVNMLCLEKTEVLVLMVLPSKIRIGLSSLPNQTV
jgi:hypothetical protein